MINIENKPSILEYYPPKSEFIGILSIPHSGEDLPDEFCQYLSTNKKDIMQDVDFRVHELVDIESLQKAGVAVIKSNIIRTAIDLNRSKEKTLLNWKSNSKGVKIVFNEPEQEATTHLIEKYYSPYYELLKTLILDLKDKMDIASLIDLHSMPSQAEDYHLKINPNQDRVRPDFCLSDIEGKSCEKDFLSLIGQDLNTSYKTVNYNNPYFGGHITRHLNSEFSNLNNIQIEISRGIYMDENSQKLKQEKVKNLKKILTASLIKHFHSFHDKYKA